MIDKTVAQEAVLERLKRLPVGSALDMRTYKRDRCVLFVRTGEDTFDVLEQGFYEERWPGIGLARIRKLFKKFMKREFPRSTKIRVYTLEPFDEADWHATRRKRI